MPAWKPIKYPTWTDNDTSQLRCYISDVYGIYSPNKTQDALNKAAAKRKHHPIREFLNSLPPWDGTKRVETLLIDYLGAEDNDYIRAVTRKTIVAAVARVFVPGIKFDSVLVMDGPQEKGKSTLFNKLAGDEWFNDGLTLTDMQDKSGAEKLQGYWILEIGELTGMRKSDIDSVKSFISRRDDKYRASYGRVVESHPRQSIIVATVNSMGGFLRDPTGNRRFWPIRVGGTEARKGWDVTDTDVLQIWAEAKHIYESGENSILKAKPLIWRSPLRRTHSRPTSAKAWCGNTSTSCCPKIGATTIWVQGARSFMGATSVRRTKAAYSGKPSVRLKSGASVLDGKRMN
jgi:predicted P-loop ATPase